MTIQFVNPIPRFVNYCDVILSRLLRIYITLFANVDPLIVTSYLIVLCNIITFGIEII
jgi:hypothetical protein